ncbi:hypothetical protein CspHIS471_0503880 [Cutaneotrichosporon sp. HIS471]|nr:hypothetical protein CspHIS471_0503880 [Cutaneotrichosporon sp. HIS471]
MASLRRPSQFFGTKSDFSVPRPRAPRVGDQGRKRDVRQSKVEEKMKTRRTSRYAGPDFSMGGGGDNYLASDPYQFTLDVAPPIMEADEYAEEPESFEPVRPRPTTTYQRPSPAVVNLQLEDDDDEEVQERNEVQDEQIRPRAQEEWDFSELGKDEFELQTYLRQVLAGADDAEKKRLVAALQRRKEETSKDLRQTVIKNYAEFVNVSKEMMTLENDMIELKELLMEWKTVPQLMGMDDSLAPTLNKDGTVERHRSRRNSPRDLNQMYRAQLTTLWSSVEGSQRFIPQAPGRRLVSETHGFVELNPATYKAKQNVSLFLLNDLLLVAGRRRVKASGVANGSNEPDQGRMVADRCWVLADLQITDVKDTGDLTNALKVKRGKDIFVFRCAKASEKKALLAALRQVSQDLLDKRRKESEAEQERRRSMWHGDAVNARMTRMSLFVGGDQMGNGRPLSTIGTSLADSKDLLWIDEFADDLTMAIATQDWDESVKFVERGQGLMRTVSNNAEASEMLQYRLDTLRPTVIQKIAQDLSSPDIRKTSAARLIALLTRLDRAELGRDTFLKARHDLMVRLVRSIKHEGDISLYINELAAVCFTVLRHTSDWYINAFQDNRMASGFVSWAKEQIEFFGDVFRRQVYAPAIDKRTVEECLRVTAGANRRLLRDVGLDFTFLIEALTAPPDAPATNRQTAHGFRPEMAQFVPSIPSLPSPSGSASPIPTPSPDPGLRGPTAPLAVPRRPSRDGTLALTPPSGMHSASSTSVNSASSGGRSAGNVPRPPPRSERRSRPPPPRPE